jgi:hypothetical protein
VRNLWPRLSGLDGAEWRESSNVSSNILYPIFTVNYFRESFGNTFTTLALGRRKRKVKLKLHGDRQSVGQSVLVSGSHLEHRTSFFRREDASVICSYNCFWALSQQSLSGASPAELSTMFYCLIWDFPNLEGQVPIFISPRNRVGQLYPGHWVPFTSPLTTRRATVKVF